MNAVKTIFSKEMRRVFKEPKMIFSLFILPVLISVGMYGFIGFMAKNMVEDIETHVSNVYIQNLPEAMEDYMQGYMEANEVTLITSDEGFDDAEAKSRINDGSLDLLVVFPEDFMECVENYADGATIPDVKTYYNPSEEYSDKAREDFMQVLNGQFYTDILASRIGRLDILNVFTVDADNAESVIMDENKASGKVIGMLVPYLITVLLFAGTMSLGSDVIAGEKERGTMASLLLTPASRISIAVGKMLALTVLSMLSAVVYIGVILITMPLGVGMLAGQSDLSYTINAGQVVMVAVIMLLLAFFYVSIVSAISVYAKSVKEAASYISPIYMLVIIAGLMTMFGSGHHQTFEYLIPIYNSALALGEIFTQDLTIPHFLMTAGTTLIIGLILSKVIASAFNSERVMFNS